MIIHVSLKWLNVSVLLVLWYSFKCHHGIGRGINCRRKMPPDHDEEAKPNAKTDATENPRESIPSQGRPCPPVEPNNHSHKKSDQSIFAFLTENFQLAYIRFTFSTLSLRYVRFTSIYHPFYTLYVLKEVR